MAWPAKTQFKAVERLPVPPEVGESFKKLRSAEIGAGYASSARRGRVGGAASERAIKAYEKVNAARAETAKHFGGDAGKAATHYKRWTRWKGAAMSPAVVAEEVVARVAKHMGADEEPMYEKMREKRSPRLTKPTRRTY